MKHGVRDYLQKPVGPIALARRLQCDVAACGPSYLENRPAPYLVFQDPVMGETLAEAEQLLINAALKRTDFNRSEAARLLGVGERTLRRKLNKK